MTLKILRAPQAQQVTGLPRSSFYSQINKGLLPPIDSAWPPQCRMG
ncbi:helix-turn-helix transcriptional regulator [Turicimonas muris]|nr:AlpA family phage regulatory protein [Turicimonas muris]